MFQVYAIYLATKHTIVNLNSRIVHFYSYQLQEMLNKKTRTKSFNKITRAKSVARQKRDCKSI